MNKPTKILLGIAFVIAVFVAHVNGQDDRTLAVIGLFLLWQIYLILREIRDKLTSVKTLMEDGLTRYFHP